MKKTLTIALLVVASSLVACGKDIPPKAKAQEVSITASTWSKLQQAYIMERETVGSDEQTAFRAPDSQYFRYETNVSGNTATLKITLKEPLDKCKNGVWTVSINAKDDTPKTQITGDGCAELTPNFHNIR
ncbi:MAG: hypothetical protein LBU89_02055 [Fibromonadaceae bacterium]|nr:hypothetical protein [Fibromonadaceae bacterium]